MLEGKMHEHRENPQESDLTFINIPPLLSRDGKKQVGIFGNEEELKRWREMRGLTEEAYPIHILPPGKSGMGTHIDIYEEDVNELIPPDKIIPFREHARAQGRKGKKPL